VWPDQSGRSHRLAGLSRVVVGRVELATLIGDVLVVAGWHGVDPAAPGADAYPRASRVDARVLELPSPPPELAPPTSGDGSRAFLALLDGGSPSGPLVVGVGRVGLLLLPEHLDGAMVDLPTFVDGALVGAGPQVRASAAHFLAQVAPLHAGPEALQVADQLRGAAELLVDRLPGSVISPGIPIGLCVDQLLGLDEHTFYLRGWARVGDGAEGLRTHLSLRSPEGARAELDEIVVRFPRPDVEAFYEASRTVRDNARSGFLACVRLDAPSRLRDGWVVELNDGAGNACEAPAPAVVDDQEIARTTVLGDLTTMESLPGADRPGRRLMASLAHPALSALQDRRCGPGAVSHSIVEVIQHGTLPAASDVSVVVPLYRRIDFLEHQMAAFAADPELCRADLVYVLDSPELARDARTLARELYPLHGVPFRLVLLRRNLGFAGATNAGASLATGRLLLLLNSDVLPDEPGWLSALVAEHDALPESAPSVPSCCTRTTPSSTPACGSTSPPARRRGRTCTTTRGCHGTSRPLTSSARSLRSPAPPCCCRAPSTSTSAAWPARSCRATSRTPTCACGCASGGWPAGTSRPSSYTTSRASPIPTSCAAPLPPTTAGCRP